MTYKTVDTAVHPETGEEYKIDDIVCIYQGRFGHNNIMTINSMFVDIESIHPEQVYISNKHYTPEDYLKPFPNNPTGTYLDSVKYKLTPKELKDLQRATNLMRKYS